MYVEPRKMVQMNWFARQKLRHRCREQMYGQQGGKATGVGDGGVMNWATGIDMYTLMCIKLMTNKNLLHKKINKIKLKIQKKRINEFCKVTDIKINKQKSVSFLYTNNNLSEREINKTIPFTIVSKRIECLVINLTRDVKDLYSENCKTLMQRCKLNINKWKGNMLMNWRN